MELNIRDNWLRISPATRQWLTENPGCVILPRALVAAIDADTLDGTDLDRHGEATLSQADRTFILAQHDPDHVVQAAAKP